MNEMSKKRALEFNIDRLSCGLMKVLYRVAFKLKKKKLIHLHR